MDKNTSFEPAIYDDAAKKRTTIDENFGDIEKSGNNSQVQEPKEKSGSPSEKQLNAQINDIFVFNSPPSNHVGLMKR